MSIFQNEKIKNQSYEIFVIKYVVHLAALFSVIRALSFLFSGKYLYSFIMSIFIFIAFTTLYCVVKGKMKEAKFLMIGGYFCVSLIFFYFRGFEILSWVIIMPLGTVLLVGLGMGFFLSLFYFITVFMLLYFRWDYFYSHLNLKQLMFETAIVYFFVLIFGVLYELIRKARMDRLQYYSNHDSLTGIANRRFFYQYGVMELEKSNRFGVPLTVLMLDLDDFKKINDKYGHAKGDHILIKFCNVVKKFVRKSDIFARIGGEEFVMMLYNVDKESSLVLAKKILNAVSSCDFDMPENMTVSIGIAAKEKNDNLDSLLKRADDALYKAKNNGKNRLEFL